MAGHALIRQLAALMLAAGLAGLSALGVVGFIDTSHRADDALQARAASERRASRHIAALQSEVRVLTGDVDALTAQLRSRGLTPVVTVAPRAHRSSATTARPTSTTATPQPSSTTTTTGPPTPTTTEPCISTPVACVPKVAR